MNSGNPSHETKSRTSPAVESDRVPHLGESSEYITLAEAAKITPGRPTANAVWRWARRGVLSRARTRIYLEHTRVGGQIFTKQQWVREFGERLAAEDTAYFRSRAAGLTATDQQTGEQRPQRNAIERELEEEGL